MCRKSNGTTADHFSLNGKEGGEEYSNTYEAGTRWWWRRRDTYKEKFQNPIATVASISKLNSAILGSQDLIDQET